MSTTSGIKYRGLLGPECYLPRRISGVIGVSPRTPHLISDSSYLVLTLAPRTAPLLRSDLVPRASARELNDGILKKDAGYIFLIGKGQFT